MESVTKKLAHEEKMHDLSGIEELIKSCGEGNGLAQQEARIALENIGEAAVEPIIQALLHSENPIIRWRAAEALGHIGGPRAIEPLIQALADKETSVQWRAIEALADIGEPAMDSLYFAAENENVEIRWGATRAVKDIKAKICMEENKCLSAKMEDICSEKIEMCSVCKKYPVVNFGYCIECSGRRGI
ncbi:MAG: HEAT repeat domain-containing protein [Candidatus Thermoplasmatota archaeon]|nr:HEAT repeat domain-containing protein [Euryarchaeota archaeon]MBU4031974.1 HEAT repeat domain-containing protein [Candidatus Thermoplasmatota archaeon]MBU4143723.1 HEAT repeat domain-containing protein [Candidatus Thermoplasmatota archaeon]MBU4592406.1 HEAT repeat domain-containing protein [Candidatus Thermoplasmatota archaeon]